MPVVNEWKKGILGEEMFSKLDGILIFTLDGHT